MRCRWHAVARRPRLEEKMLWIWATRFQRITEDWPLALNPRFLDNLSFFRASYWAEKFTLSRVKMQSEDFEELKQSASISQNPLRSQLICARATAYGFLKERLQQKDPDGSFHDDSLESSSTTSLWTHCIQSVYGGHLEYPSPQPIPHISSGSLQELLLNTCLNIYPSPPRWMHVNLQLTTQTSFFSEKGGKSTNMSLDSKSTELNIDNVSTCALGKLLTKDWWHVFSLMPVAKEQLLLPAWEALIIHCSKE